MSFNKETGMYEGYIYKITNDINEKLYIGQTITTIKDRFRKHISDSFNRNDNMAIHLAIRKYGKENFHVYEIEKIENKDKNDLIVLLSEKEIEYILFYNTKCPNGYNISDGGNNIEKDKNPVIQYNTFTCEYTYYESISEASTKTDIDSSLICACCKRKVFSCKGSIFKYASEGITEDDINEYIKLHPKIKKYDYNGMLIETYLTSVLAAESVKNIYPKASGTSIISCCKGKLKTAYNYVWKYEYDEFDKSDPYYKNISLNKKYISKNNEVIEKRNKYTGELLDEYNNFYNIEERLKLSKNQLKKIRSCCNKKIVSAFGYYWCYKNEFNKNDLDRIADTPIDMYSLDGKLLNSFNKIVDGLNFIGIDKRFSGVIANCCIGKTETAYGYVWRYKGEAFGKPIKKDRNNTPVDICMYTLDGVLVNTYADTKDIAEVYDLELWQVRNLINKHRCIESKYVLFYSDEDFNKNIITYFKEQRINQYDLDNKYINRYQNASEAGRKNNTDASAILKCCKKKSKTANKYKWFYVNDSTQPDKTKIIV